MSFLTAIAARSSRSLPALAVAAALALLAPSPARAGFDRASGQDADSFQTNEAASSSNRAASSSGLRLESALGGLTQRSGKEARYYDPEVGIFLSRDSYEGDLADVPSLHRYAYAEENPLLYSDPTGHAVCTGDPEQCAAMFEQATRLKRVVPGFDPHTLVVGEGMTTVLAIGPAGGFNDLVVWTPYIADALSKEVATYRETHSKQGRPYGVSASTLEYLTYFFETLSQSTAKTSEAQLAGVLQAISMDEKADIPYRLDPWRLESIDPAMLGMTSRQMQGMFAMARHHNELMGSVRRVGLAEGVVFMAGTAAAAAAEAVQAERAAARAAAMEKAAVGAAERQSLKRIVAAQKAERTPRPFVWSADPDHMFGPLGAPVGTLPNGNSYGLTSQGVHWERTPGGNIKFYPQGRTQPVRIQFHAGENPAPGETFNPRHHGPHWHVESKKNPNGGWGASNTQKAKPPGYTNGSGTGWMSGEELPKSWDVN